MTNNAQTTVETTTTINYYIRSSILGGKPIVEVNQSGTQSEGYIYAAGALLAKQIGLCPGCPPDVQWQEANPLTGSRYEVYTGGYGDLQERDPLGANTGTEDPYQYQSEPSFLDLVQPEQLLFIDGGSDPFNPGKCEKDGMAYDCGRLDREIENGAVGGDVYRNGRYIGYTDILGSGSVGGRHFALAYLPDEFSEDLSPTNGDLATVNIRAGEAYFIEVAVSGSAGQTRDIPKASEIAAREKAKPPITDCEKYLANLLTDNGYVSVGFDYTSKGSNGETPHYRGDSINTNGTFSQGHLHVFAHVYADFNADSDANFYIPAGGRLLIPNTRIKSGGASFGDISRSSYVLVQFSSLGSYNHPVTLFVGHIKGVPSPRSVNRKNVINTRRLIGTTGGAGGEGLGGGANHIHLELLEGLHSSIPVKKNWVPVTKICP